MDPNLEWEVFQIMLHRTVLEFPANQTLGVKDGVLRICSQLIFGSVSNEPNIGSFNALPVGIKEKLFTNLSPSAVKAT